MFYVNTTELLAKYILFPAVCDRICFDAKAGFY